MAHRRVLTLVLAVHLVGIAVFLFVFLRPRLPAAERGRRLAERTGCYGCHGPEGTEGAANPGRTELTVPTWGGDLMMFGHDPQDIREWIRDGVTRKRAQSETWRQERDRGTLRMPAFKGRLSTSQIDDLVAFVSAVHGMPEPEDSTVIRGRERIDSLGCTGCHGYGGRLARWNPGSLKGYVPSWDGADFPDLVKSAAEFREWVEHGVSDRFKQNPFARFFLDRAVLRMPAFQSHLEPGDVDAIWAYVQWLRSRSGREEGATQMREE